MIPVGFLSLLGVLFIALKLTGVIAWSWLWVLAPIWGGLAFYALFMIAFIIVCEIVRR